MFLWAIMKAINKSNGQADASPSIPPLYQKPSFPFKRCHFNVSYILMVKFLTVQVPEALHQMDHTEFHSVQCVLMTAS